MPNIDQDSDQAVLQGRDMMHNPQNRYGRSQQLPNRSRRGKANTVQGSEDQALLPDGNLDNP
jgi:hypothetical protein